MSTDPAASRRSRVSHVLRWSRAVLFVGAASTCLTTGAAQAGDAEHDTGGEGDDGWRKKVFEQVKRSLVNVDDFVDAQWRRFMRDKGLDAPRYIAAYSAFGNQDRLWVRGRLLANKPYGGPKEDDGWWDNLAATYQRWESDEVPGATVTLDYGDAELQVVTDGEGYYHAVFELEKGEPRADAVIARYPFDS